MAVVLPNTVLTVRSLPHPWERDANGVPVPPNPNLPAPARGSWPASALEQLDGSWSIRLDPQAWPVEPGDTVTDAAGRTWTLTSARNHTVPGCSAADYVQATATLNPPEIP